MRLTRALMYYVNRKRIPGHIEIGKHRKFKPVYPHQKYVAALDMVREQRNIEILSRPYLTEEQDEEYQKVLDKQAEEQDKQDKVKFITSRMPKHYTTLENFEHLKRTKSWS